MSLSNLLRKWNQRPVTFTGRGVLRAGKLALILGGLTLGGIGISSCIKYLNRDIRIEKPNPENFNGAWGSVEDYTYGRGGPTRFIVDEDNDGNADLIQYGGKADWVAEGYQPPKGNFFTRDARVMTPEMREAATEAMKTDQRLSYLMAQRAYELQEQTGGK